MHLEVVQSTAHHSFYPISSVLILAEEDGWLAGVGGNVRNYWLAEGGKTTGQGFTLKVDSCPRWIAGVQIKNKGKGGYTTWATREFKISGAKNVNGPWQTLVQNELSNTTGGNAAFLLNFTFEQPVEVQYLRFDLISYWGKGGGLQYFAAIPATSKKHQY